MPFQIPLFKEPEMWKPDPMEAVEQRPHPLLFEPAINRSMRERKHVEMREKLEKAAKMHPQGNVDAVMKAYEDFTQGDRRLCAAELFLQLYYQAAAKGLLLQWFKKLEGRNTHVPVPDRDKVAVAR